MSLNITFADDCLPEIKSNGATWITEAIDWSMTQYDEVDLYANTTWHIMPFEFSATAVKPQLRPVEIKLSEADNCFFTTELTAREWFKNSYFYVGHEIGLISSAIAILRGVKHTLARDIPDEPYRDNWSLEVDPENEKLKWLKEAHPDLRGSWVDRANWLTDHISKIPHTHWQFPPTPKGLCRLSGAAGAGAVWPPGCER